ncbi:NADH-ubiquinone oxidoreductase subunit E family protein [Helicobacter himalayensis]|uniref:NADH-ubiquinone oxidoreductase subunit E family protein n=1 Tax=Helicobacter himalayensis TaxID=1591088 RepID=UPI00082F3BED|nr:NADH-ubiquinone oxidoreductase subunit E family protein [Helicobacter himalayensis]
MKRFDLRHLHNDFLPRLQELLAQSEIGEVSFFLFEVDVFENTHKASLSAQECGAQILNSIRFNERDWTLIVRKVQNVSLIQNAQSCEVVK